MATAEMSAIAQKELQELYNSIPRDTSCPYYKKGCPVENCQIHDKPYNPSRGHCSLREFMEGRGVEHSVEMLRIISDMPCANLAQEEVKKGKLNLATALILELP